jgi:hypothetical protein
VASNQVLQPVITAVLENGTSGALFLAYFPYFEKISVVLWDRLVCVSSYPISHQLLNACTNVSQTWYVYQGIWALRNDVLHKSLPSVCVMFTSFIVARQRLGRQFPSATNASNNRRMVGGIDFYTARVVSRDSLWVCLCTTLYLIGNGSVNTFSWHRRIVEGLVF